MEFSLLTVSRSPVSHVAALAATGLPWMRNRAPQRSANGFNQFGVVVLRRADFAGNHHPPSSIASQQLIIKVARVVSWSSFGVVDDYQIAVHH
jgi:hypothetical protein